VSGSCPIGWGLETLIASTLLMVVVLAIRGPLRRAFGAPVAYALWALPLLRMLLPPLPNQWREAAVSAPIAQAGQSVSYYVIAPLGRVAAAPVPSAPSLSAALAVLWCAGAVTFLLWHAVSHLRFVRRLLADPSHEQAVGGIRVIETAAAAGPLAFGVWRKYVAFPRDFGERYDADERDLALAHELGHHARGDLVANWAALGMLALHWFNPIAWRAFRAFRADQEMANDAAVLAGRSPAQRHAYACAIVKSAHGGSLSAACHLHTIHDLKGRLRMLSTGPASRARLVTGVAAVSTLTIAGLGLTASGTQAAERIRVRIEKTTGVKLAVPAPPAFVAQSLPFPESPGAAPEVPMPLDPEAHVPPAPEDAVPPVPPAPPEAYIRHVPGSHRHGTTDGPVSNADIAAIVARAPQVSSRDDCPIDGGKRNEVVLRRQDRDKQRIIICTNRIAKLESDAVAAASVDTAAIERNAYSSALAGIRAGRAALLARKNMPEEARADALANLDSSIADLERDLAEAR